MIDIAFQMLSFFVITTHPVSVITNLDVYRPSQDKTASQAKQPPKMIKIMVLPNDVFSINDKIIELQDLDRLLSKLAALDTQQTIMIMCTPESQHGQLVEVLDLCAKSGLVNLSVVSTS